MTGPEFSNATHPRVTAEYGYTQFAEKFQEDLDRAELWQLQITDAEKNGCSREEVHNIASSAIEDLDASWEYEGYTFLVAGTWVVPELNFDSDSNGPTESQGISWRFEEEDVCEPRTSYGWGYHVINDEVKLGLVFNTDHASITVPYMNIEISRNGFAMPSKVSLELLTAPSEEQKIVHSERVIETLEVYDKLLKLYMKQDSFLTQSRQKQKNVINDQITKASETIFAAGIGLYLDSHVSEFYTRAETSTPYGYEYCIVTDMNGNEHAPLRGCIMGLAVLEQELLEENPIRSKQDFISSDAGLCLIVEVYGDNPATLYVPYSATRVSEETLNVYNTV